MLRLPLPLRRGHRHHRQEMGPLRSRPTWQQWNTTIQPATRQTARHQRKNPHRSTQRDTESRHSETRSLRRNPPESRIPPQQRRNRTNNPSRSTDGLGGQDGRAHPARNLDHPQLLSPKLILGCYREFAGINPKYRDAINLTYLPLQRYRAYEKWKSKRVRVLLLAESPPWGDKSAYFYNEQRSGGLSEAVFNQLKIKGESKSTKLCEFKRRQFFLTDTVKCVFDKSQTGFIPQELIRRSAQEILQEELLALRPKFILALGATALAGLKQIERFSRVLSRYRSITKASGKSVRVGKTTLILSVFPNDRNRRYEKSISSAFQMVG